MDRVKGAIFSSLGERVIGAQVLDLFGGAGGLGIEALSRGADSAVFVESNRIAAQSIERNLVASKLRGTVWVEDAFGFLKRTPGHFDLIFSDPPYERAAGGESFTTLLLHDANIPRVLAHDGLFILEKSPAEPLPTQTQWIVTRARKYGATEVLFLARSK